jgi:hypothetical protein
MAHHRGPPARFVADWWRLALGLAVVAVVAILLAILLVALGL